jgi:uncharacterized membrane protein YhaH (DUF805 family)
MASYAPPVKCPECGGEAPDGAVTCDKCGFPLKERGGNAHPPYVNVARTVSLASPDSDDSDSFEAAKDFSLWQGFVNGWKNYFNFGGRARRKEYWGWLFFRCVFSVGVIVLVAIFSGGDEGMVKGISWFIAAAAFIPDIAVSIRRIHDTGNSGWWLLIPVLGFLLLFTDGTVGENQYGQDPKGREPI